MTEFEIAEILESDLAAYNLVVQVTQQDEFLLITLVRPLNSNISYTEITKAIAARIKALQLPGINTLLLYSRFLGEYDIDWQTRLELIIPPEVSVQQTFQQGFKLSDYCFTRNKSLLTAELLPPSENIARLVQFFHALPNSVKERILPILDPFFRSANSQSTDQFDTEVQQWFEQLSQLNDSEARKASIWFSRYCFNPKKTMVEVMVTLEPGSVEPVDASPPEQTPKQVPRTQPVQETSQTPTQTNTPKTKKTALSTNWQMLALPIGWIIFVIIMVIIAVFSVNPSEEINTACLNSVGSQNYCRLAIQLMGELTFQEVSKEAVPPSSARREQSLSDCTFVANLRAGKTFKENFEEHPHPLSKFGEEVVPGILIADINQTNFKVSGSTVRTACVFLNSKTQLQRIGTDVIPNSWPSEPYKSQPIHQESIRKALGIYNVLLALGAGTLFSAIGIYLANMFGFGIIVYRLETLLIAAFFLGIIEIFTSVIPRLSIFSFIAEIAIESLALGLVSTFVKGFKIDWAAGYRLVACGAGTILAVKYLLNLGLFSLIATLVNAKIT